MEREMGCIPDQSPREDIPRPPPTPRFPRPHLPRSQVGGGESAPSSVADSLAPRRRRRRCPAAAASSLQLGAPGLGYNHPLLPGAHSRVVRCPAGP